MLECDGDGRLYFAYGANLNIEHMRMRCPAARAAGPAHLSGYRFLVNGCGWATVVADPDAAVHGVLWWLSSSCEVALDEQEGVATSLYGKQTLLVTGANGQQVEAMVYVATDSKPGRPNPGYLERILRWAADWRLPEDYRAEIAAFGG